MIMMTSDWNFGLPFRSQVQDDENNCILLLVLSTCHRLHDFISWNSGWIWEGRWHIKHITCDYTFSIKIIFGRNLFNSYFMNTEIYFYLVIHRQILVSVKKNEIRYISYIWNSNVSWHSGLHSGAREAEAGVTSISFISFLHTEWIWNTWSRQTGRKYSTMYLLIIFVVQVVWARSWF